ncbi:MAG: DUF859 domain-containing protein [Oscillospiraceae bacterium]|nr:DUF859 domain-containing protein [Oscillospiraceae bacterium]
MAVSNNFTTNNSYIIYYIECITNSQNIANNTSNVTAKVWCKRTNTGYTTYGTGTCYCTINGTQYSASITSNQKITSTAIALFTKTLDIPHNADGTKSLSISARIDHSQFSSSPQIQSTSFTLTTIPRASTISNITPASVEVNGSNGVTVNINRASSSFTHDVKMTIGTVQVYSTTNVATSISVSPIPMSWLNNLPNATSGTVTATVTTKSGNSTIGSTTSTFVVTVPQNVVPSAGTLTVSRVNNDVPEAWKILVQGKSQIRMILSGANGSYGGTIKTQELKCDNFTATTTDATTGVLMNAGTVTTSWIVKDSRNRATQGTAVNHTVWPYQSPYIVTRISQRCLQNGTLDDNGTYVKCTAGVLYSDCNGNNQLQCKVYYKETGTTNWDNGIAFTNGNSVVTGGGNIDPNKSYDIKYEIIDQFYTVQTWDLVSTSFSTVDYRIGGKGIAFGKASESDGFDCGMPANFTDVPTIGINLMTGLPFVEVLKSGNFDCYKLFNGDFWIYGSVAIATSGITAGTQYASSGWYRYFANLSIPIANFGIDGSLINDNCEILTQIYRGNQTNTQVSLGARVLDSNGTIEVGTMKPSGSIEAFNIHISIHGKGEQT